MPPNSKLVNTVPNARIADELGVAPASSGSTVFYWVALALCSG